MSVIRVFIYGSLLPGHSNHHVVSDFIRHSVEGEIQGRLVDYGPYPAAIRDAEAASKTIRGMWIDVDRDGLASMDVLEGFIGIEESNDYDRVWAADLQDCSLAGWVYVWNESRGYPAIPDRYWPDYFARKTG
ncbi:gamma-glutamylcyclotransferase family protein [Paenibacillus sp. LHD-117]|uniref:gamma-glutamylcyclotransferase family protein n=1 Tax=Paenibacillus sp. LHD-117 TaxID=3071412 RepID=UPI0027DFE268|nr:gamma-glutamylcyclotransferase family protein [Paenibacillus sp. LHD-117]MDQ6423020.1 gamma-glutamylcyclotransferase family protein [Paenibacillus sp. LHD-117]